MPDYIVDASVVIAYIVTTPFTANSTALFKQGKADERLIVPEFGRLECVNVIWKYVRFQGMAQSQAEQNIQDLLALPLKIVPVTDLLTDALHIGIRQQLAIYDSIYIALAKHLNLSLISADQGQQKAAQKEGVTLKPLTDFKP